MNEWQQGFMCVEHNKKFCEQCEPPQIEFATNMQWIGKPIQGDKYLTYNGNIITPGWQWVNVHATLPEIFDMLSVDGFPIAPSLNPPELDNKPNHTGLNRKEMYFKSAQIALVDVDSGMTIPELKENPYYRKFSSGYYTTPSHTRKKPKFRIIFLLENPITDPFRMKMLYRGFIALFGGDPACKDGCRLFYGSPNAMSKQLIEDNYLPDLITDAIIEQQIRIYQEEFAQVKSVSYEPPSDKVKARILELLSQTYIGNYDIWFEVGSGMKTAGFELQDFINVSVGGLMRSKSPERCKSVWNDMKAGYYSLGTVIYFLKSHYGDEVVKDIYA